MSANALAALLDSPEVLAAAIFVLALINHALGARARRSYSNQSFIEQEAYLPPGSGGQAQPDRARMTWTWFLALISISLTLSADPVTREIFGGGYFVLLLAGLALNVTSFLMVRALLKPGAAEGRLRYSAVYGYRSGGAQTMGLAGFTAAVGILFGSLAFLAGSVFLLLGAIAWYWRAWRTARKAVQ